MDFRGKAIEGHDLGHPGAGDPLATGDLGLGSDVAGVELPPPILGLPEELNHRGLPWRPWGLRRPSGVGGRVHDPLRGDSPFQGADAPVFERPFRTEGDLNGLFAQLGPG